MPCFLFFSENYGNASSKLHEFGWLADAAVDAPGEGELAGDPEGLGDAEGFTDPDGLGDGARLPEGAGLGETKEVVLGLGETPTVTDGDGSGLAGVPHCAR